jgi:membrane dipeptidase
MIGPDHVGLGSDFDGIESPPKQLDDVTTYPLITRELLKRGYKPEDIMKILGGNFIRVLKANEVPEPPAPASVTR